MHVGNNLIKCLKNIIGVTLIDTGGERKMFCFVFVILLFVYHVGITFSAYCREMKQFS